MARDKRAALADLRALEEQAERANPVAPSTKRKAVKGAGATPATGLSQFRGGRSKKMPSLKVAELKMTPSLHNALEDEMALMPSGEYDGAGKHSLLDHLKHPMKGFGDYLHAMEAAAPAKKILSGATRKGGLKTGKYEGEGLAGGIAAQALALVTFLVGRIRGGRLTRDAAVRAINADADLTAADKAWAVNALDRVLADSRVLRTLAREVERPDDSDSDDSQATIPLPRAKEITGTTGTTGRGATPSTGLSRFRGGMAIGQVVGSGKMKQAAMDAESESDEEMEGCGPAVPEVAPVKGKKKRAPAGPDDGRRKRAAVVKKVMAEKGLSMIQASKYVKEHGLY